jgi:hypothetical protein
MNKQGFINHFTAARRSSNGPTQCLSLVSRGGYASLLVDLSE